MSGHDVHVKPVIYAGCGFMLGIAIAIGAVLALLTAWHEPFGGLPSGAVGLVPALEGRGPALQSAPQNDHAAYLAAEERQRAASEAAR